MVEDREDERLEQHPLGEGRLDDEHRRAGEVALTLGIAAHVAGEAVGGQPVERRLVDHPLVGEEAQLVVAEAEGLERLEDAPSTTDDAVAPPIGQAPREGLEDAAPVGLARGERGLEHRQLVVVGQQGGAGGGRPASAHHATLRAAATRHTADVGP